MCILGELAGGRPMAVAVGVSDIKCQRNSKSYDKNCFFGAEFFIYIGRFKKNREYSRGELLDPLIKMFYAWVLAKPLL